MTSPMPAIHSRLVVISWWSNCLGLACLHQLSAHTSQCPIHVLQVGKSESQKALFRQHLPPGILELPYPEEAPAEHSQVIQHLVTQRLTTSHGLWLLDHDLFIQADCEAWFQAADLQLTRVDYCLCLPRLNRPQPGITSPVFWLSPARWPSGLRGFDPLPFQPRPEARRPDLHRSQLELRLPEKDTLIQARDELLAQGLASYFNIDSAPSQASLPAPLLTLPPFPAHTHLGGLSLFTGVIPEALLHAQPSFKDWARNVVYSFTLFFETQCPAAWLSIEEPELLRRLHEFRSILNG
jgi:hypothetical protein